MANEFYRAQHAKISDLAEQLTKAIGPGTAANAEKIKDILNKLASTLSLHLTAEDNALYPRLIADSRPQISDLAKRFQQEMGGLKKAFTSYASKWSSALIAKEADGFARETRGVVAALMARIGREDREFYPAIGL